VFGLDSHLCITESMPRPGFPDLSLVCRYVSSAHTLTKVPMYTTCKTASKSRAVKRRFLDAGLTVPTLAGESGRTNERRERSYEYECKQLCHRDGTYYMNKAFAANG